MKISMMAMAALLAFAVPATGAEIRNVVAAQDGNRVRLQYDLVATADEDRDGVGVYIEYAGKRYPVDDLHISGDYGKSVMTGSNKKIYWEVLEDVPAGIVGEVTWDVVTFTERDAVAKGKATEAAREKEKMRVSEQNAKRKEVERNGSDAKRFIPSPSL